MSNVEDLKEQIQGYRKKYYQNHLLKGSLIGGGLIFGVFIFVNVLEFWGRFGNELRAFLFFSFLIISGLVLFFGVLRPLFYLYNINKPLSDTDAAQQIGAFFPTIKDKLLNTLQLANQSAGSDSHLLKASIDQKSKELAIVRFSDAVNFSENRKYLKYALIPILLIALISAIKPSFFKSTERIVNFSKTFQEPAPFQFEILNKNLNATKNEDFVLKLKLVGNTIPNETFMVFNDRKYKMNVQDPQNFEFVFPNVQKATEFHFLAGGFTSNTFNLKLTSRPSLTSFDVNLTYPGYLNKPAETFQNLGNLVVPQGTQIKWKFKTSETDSLSMVFDGNQKIKLSQGLFSDFSVDKKLMQSTAYEILLKNQYISNADKIGYYINVVPDKFPTIQVEQIRDTSLFTYIGLGGSISDDFGITDLRFYYKNAQAKNAQFKSVAIPFNKSSISQTFFYQVNIAQLSLNKGDELEYFVQVTDNDGVNGKKSSKSTLLKFGMPTAAEFDKDIEKQLQKSEDQFEKLLKKSLDFKKNLENLDSELKKKKGLDFQDKKDLEELIKKKEDLQKEIRELQKEIQDLKDKQNRFEQQNPELQKKMDMLQQLLDDIMKAADSKTLEKMKEDLEKNLDEKSLNKLDDFKKNNRNIDRNIERAQKLFQNMQFKQKIENAAKELEKLAEKQEELANKTEKENNIEKNQELQKEQEKLNKEFEEKKEKLKEIEKLAEQQKKDVDTKKEEQQEIQKEQEKAKQDMKKNDSKAASKSQKKAAKSMRNLAAEMMEGQANGESKQLELDIDALRDILENLIKVSHNQESIMSNFKNISVSDPKFVSLSQQQLKIADDAKIIEDSLYMLAKRVMQIESFVTKEVTDMKNHIDQSLTFIKERKLPQAASKQQFSMTSMNNLALMLSDQFKQMQQMMGAPGGGASGGKGNEPSDGMGKSQQQLNKKMEGMSGQGSGGKENQGKEFSKELAKIANEQAKLRRQVQELQNQLNGTPEGKKVGNSLSEIQKKMDETENDLINKRIGPKLVERNKEIETRLLEAEKAIKEQELDPKRKSNTGVTFTRSTPPDLEVFKRAKEKQVELLRTTPPNFTPFYKQKTDNYFKNLK
ncbi:MAG: DUF4175 family protein [Leadbetterella sp.]